MSVMRGITAFAATATLAACMSGVMPALPATPSHAATVSYHVLFDDTKAETAGNADWIISTSMPDPTAQNPNPSSETDWTGALSSWGVALQKSGAYGLDTLPPGGRITYGDTTNALDLSKFNAFVLPEPNVLFTAAEKTAILNFVHAGGGLFMISDHSGSDRNNDGVDSVQVLNDLMGTGDPFGFSIDSLNISSENPNVLGSTDPVLSGPFGKVTGTIIRNGTTATLHPSDNPSVKGEVYRSGYPAGGTTGAAVASSTYGSGRVVYWGDSSPIDDGTGQSGNTLYNGWTDPAGTDGDARAERDRLAGGLGFVRRGGGGGGGGGSALTNGGFEAGTAPWTLSGPYVVTSQAHSGTHSLHFGAVTSETDTATQTFTVPSSGNLTWWTRMTTTDTGSTAHDKLAVQLGSTTVKTFTNTGAKSIWTSSAVSLASVRRTDGDAHVHGDQRCEQPDDILGR